LEIDSRIIVPLAMAHDKSDAQIQKDNLFSPKILFYLSFIFIIIEGYNFTDLFPIERSAFEHL
jgi:hypothetical protein